MSNALKPLEALTVGYCIKKMLPITMAILVTKGSNYVTLVKVKAEDDLIFIDQLRKLLAIKKSFDM